ncbi:MAG: dihydroorotate dehydrogenase [Oscillospiraceae bacterium]|nr:dihydroorotate dehydrogenase [Oscillospiraceae bacterium]
MADLSVNIAGVGFKNPLIAASGCFGFGREYEEFYPLSLLGGISTKGMTRNPRDGNPPPRVAETRGGMLNSVGLQNPGIEYFIQHELPYLRQKNTVIIANIAGFTIDEFVQMAEMLDTTDVDMLELNISCPNVKQGGVSFGICRDNAAAVVSAVRAVTSKPLMVKLTPNVTDIADIARAVEFAGADAISLINTLLGMRIDIDTRRPILRNNVGGLSGPAVFPVALRMVWQVAKAVEIPVIGLGGISTPRDALEMIIAGASAFQVGTELFSDPDCPAKILSGISEWMDQNGIESIGEIKGTLKIWE